MSAHTMRKLASVIHFALRLDLVGVPSMRAAEAEVRPLLQRDQWQFEDRAAWEWQGDGDATTLVLSKPSQYAPKVRRPFNLAWFAGGEWTSFTLTAEVRLDAFTQGNNDLCLAFGGVGESQFYYAHLGEAADAAHLQLHVVNQADRKPITTNRAKTLPWQPNHWYRVRLVRDAETGSVKVWFDDALVLEGNDKTFGKGRIGLGSFDDLGAFRNVVITPAATSR